MHTYRKHLGGPLWTVGFFNPNNHARWEPLKDFLREEHAAAYVNYLNGGEGSPLVGLEGESRFLRWYFRGKIENFREGIDEWMSSQ